MKNIPFLLPVCALFLVSVLSGQTPATASAAAPATVPVASPAGHGGRFLQPGDVAPEFSVVNAKGDPIRLSDFRGKVVIVDISATWCGPCQAAMPNNDRVYRKYAAQGVVLLGITADDTQAAYDGWIARNAGKYEFTMLFDPKGRAGWDESVFNTQYHITGFPTMFVVGRDGKISEVVSGGGPGEDYRLEYALARAGVKVDLAALPPEPKKDPAGPKAIPMVGKTAAMPATTAMIGMGAPAPAGGGFTPERFGSIARGAAVPDFTVTGADGQPVKLSSFRGKPLLVQFCTGNGPQPWFAKIAAAYKDQSLNALAVFSAADKADFDAWVAANPKPGFAVAWDPAGKAWAENVTNTLFGVGMYPATAVLQADGTLWSGAIGMGDKVVAMVYSMLARNGVKLLPEHLDALVAAGGAMKMGGSPAAAPATAGGEAAPAPKAPFSEKYGKLKAGDPMPDFMVRTVDGQEAKFSDLAKGKTVVLDFWATWCGPCQQAMPHYEEMHRKYSGQNVLFLGICCFDQREAYDKWVAANKDKYTFTTVFDPVGKPASGDKEAMQKTIMMQVSGGALTPLPTTLVINAAGKLVGSYVGYGPGTHAGLANLLMIAGVPLADEDKPKTFFPAGFTLRKAEAMAAATIKPAPGSGKPEPARPTTLAAGATAPDFTMKDLAGKELKLSDFKGKVVILDFWATWCGPCIGSFPHTQKIAAQYKDQDVVVLASCTSDTRAAFEKWVPANQEKYADILFAADPNGRGTPTFDQRASAALYGVTGIPTQFVIGRDGKIVATIVGNGGDGDPRTEGALALAGVKVDEALAGKGKQALLAAAAEEKQRALDAAETAKNPPPPFFESMGKLVAGQPLPLADFTAQGPDGAPVKFSDLSKGKITVLNVWQMGSAADYLAFQDAWARKYAAQNVQFVALASYCNRDDYDKFLADNAGKFSFPILFDPVGRFAAPAKTPAEMTVEEKREYSARQKEHFAKVIAMQLAGGMMMPVPNNLVLDAQGRLLGGYIGAGEKSAAALGNLLHRAGVKLAPEDLPKKLYTAEETKPKAPPAPVAMLKVGAPAPDFPATDAAGQPVKVSDYRGKIIILDFWATWCGPCIASMPHTQEVAAHYKDQGVVVLASCTSDTRAKFDAWVKANQARFPDMIFSHDPLEKSDDRAARKLYGVGGIPQQFIIGRDGTIAALCMGYLKGEVLLEAALAEAGVKVAPEILAKAKLDQANRDAMK